jgi:hypothetical protein
MNSINVKRYMVSRSEGHNSHVPNHAGEKRGYRLVAVIAGWYNVLAKNLQAGRVHVLEKEQRPVRTKMVS